MTLENASKLPSFLPCSFFPPSQQQPPLSDSRQIRKCAGRMPRAWQSGSLPPSPPSVSCQIGGGGGGTRGRFSVTSSSLLPSTLFSAAP